MAPAGATGSARGVSSKGVRGGVPKGTQAVPSVANDALQGTQSVLKGTQSGLKGTHAPDGATAGTLVVGAGVNSGVGAGVATGVGAGVGGAGVTAQRWTARQIGRCECPRSTPRVEPARREQCRAVPWAAPWYVQACSRPTMHARAHAHTHTHTHARANMP
jgi:hypothetical protein